MRGLVRARWLRIGRRVLLAAVAVVAALMLWSHARQVPAALRLLRRPDREWLVVIGASAVLTHLAATMCVRGSTTARLRTARTLVVQMAASFTNRIAPAGLGGVALNVRYLEREGVSRHGAVASVTLNTVVGFVAHVAIFVTVGAFGSSVHADVVSLVWPVAIALAAVVGLAALPAVRRRTVEARVGRALREAAAGMARVLASPRRFGQLFGGSVGVTLAHGLGLYAAVRAYGAAPGFGRILTVYLVASAVGAVSPTPGGLGALEAALVAGLTGSAVPASAALSAVLTYRLITYWLPVVPGAYAIRWLRRREFV